ncbi:LysR substrate-binding domain-containing protein [Pseudomonas syringae]|uniref:LysR substrate-binding domain-containing protein n=1 Tax=Pseudomonas syringae TaxID=317 RepID=UPI0009B50A42|nr:LysR substrate-binding domain-containing protein [Pseudomonas syringae]
MSLRRFPSIASLRGFEACVRHLNFSQAAAELHITQSAISHQIKQLEDLLGVELFERSSGAIKLTQQGAELLPVIRVFFKDMSSVVDRFERGERQAFMLEIFVHDSFATTWLIPRLSRFYKLWPDIKIKLRTEEFARFDNPNVQVAIRLGTQAACWPGLFSEFILAERIFPVCSGALLAALGSPASAEDILRFPLILRARNTLSGQPVSSPSWEYWLDKYNVPANSLNCALAVPYTAMAVHAALRGLGVAMARTSHISDELNTGRLQKLFEDELDTDGGYYVLCSPGKEKTLEIQAFMEWVKAEALR